MRTAKVPWWTLVAIGLVAVAIGYWVQAVIESRALQGASRRTYTYAIDAPLGLVWQNADWPSVWAGIAAAAVVTAVGLVVAYRVRRPSTS